MGYPSQSEADLALAGYLLWHHRGRRGGGGPPLPPLGPLPPQVGREAGEPHLRGAHPEAGHGPQGLRSRIRSRVRWRRRGTAFSLRRTRRRSVLGSSAPQASKATGTREARKRGPPGPPCSPSSTRRAWPAATAFSRGVHEESSPAPGPAPLRSRCRGRERRERAAWARAASSPGRGRSPRGRAGEAQHPCRQGQEDPRLHLSLHHGLRRLEADPAPQHLELAPLHLLLGEPGEGLLLPILLSSSLSSFLLLSSSLPFPSPPLPGSPPGGRGPPPPPRGRPPPSPPPL